MLNRDIYQKDPSTRKLVNEGVASVNDEKTSHALSVLRYELETFVCDGQYEEGLKDILETYLKNIDAAQQPGVWVSGFFGSGKSHLVKMLRALWVDCAFDDGATPRGIAKLPQSVSDQFKELTTQAKRHGGLHAASGTLGASSRDRSVRLAVLSLIFKSADLPEQYPVACFVMWLQREGIFQAVRSQVEKKGFDWNEELDNFYVAEGLHEALVNAKPNLFTSPASCVETLNNLYPYVQDVSSGDMLKAIRQALTRDGKFPLTLVVLDEVQQYIGADVLNVAFPGGGLEGSMIQYLGSEEFQKNPPKILIWEFSPLYRLDQETIYRQMMALLDNGCEGKTAQMTASTTLKPGKNELLVNSSNKDLRNANHQVDIRFADPSVKTLQATLWYMNGRHEDIKIEKPETSDTDGRFVFQMREDEDWASQNLLAIEIQGPEDAGDAQKVDAKICKRNVFSHSAPLNAQAGR